MQASVLVKTKDMDKSEWLQWRRKGIGGSDAAAIAGLSRYKSPVQVWLEKTGQVEPEEPGEAAYWGQVLEDIVAKEFTVRTGKKLKRRLAILQHPQYPFMIANIDRVVVGEEAGFEAKTTSEWHKDEWEEDKIPDEYILQCQHYMAVTGFSKWYIAVLIGGNKFRWKVIERDEEIIQYLIKIESDFWKLVETNTPPEMDGSQASTEALKLLYPKAEEGKAIELPLSTQDLIEEYEQICEKEKEIAEQKEAVVNKLKALLGDAEIGYVGNKRVIWKNISSARLDTKALKEEIPEVYEKYAKLTTYRRFEIK